MEKVKIKNDVEISFDDIIRQYEVSDVDSMTQIISDTFESYACDCNILNTIIRIILNCSPVKDELKFLDVENVKNLLKIIE